jgi:hypothetical protein
MAQTYGNSDNNATNLTVDNFFNVVDSALGNVNYGMTPYLMQYVFCADVGAGTPSVGISGHGPNFVGAGHVTNLFDKFFDSFPDFRMAQGMLMPKGAPSLTGRLYARDADAPPTIGVRVTLTGTFTRPWFRKKQKIKDKISHYSKPLSDIQADGTQVTTIEGFAVFSFDNKSLVSQLAVYLDRYKIMTDLLPPSDALTAQWVRQVEEEVGGKSKK